MQSKTWKFWTVMIFLVLASSQILPFVFGPFGIEKSGALHDPRSFSQGQNSLTAQQTRSFVRDISTDAQRPKKGLTQDFIKTPETQHERIGTP